jgi:hypothetical protein
LFVEILRPVVPPRPKLEFMVFPTRTDTYVWKIVGIETNRTISRHKNLREALRRCAQLNRHLEEPAMGFCEYETPESSWGACDGGQRCNHTGTVHDLASELDLCPKHFELMGAL